MRIPSRAFPLLAAIAVAAASSVQAQAARSDAGSVAEIRDNRFKWFFGAQVGAMMFETPSQTQTGVPSLGAHLAIVSRRAGLMIGVDEAFGSGESTGFLDINSGGIARSMTFDRLRRYQFSMTGYPVRGSLEPYLGLGFGMLQVINPQFDNEFFATAEEEAFSAADAHEKSATGFMSLMAGVQFRVGRMAAFGQYQITSSPAAGNLLKGPGHSLMGGLRWSLGSSKEGVRGRGY